MRIDVECYAGFKGEETPRRIRLGERHLDVVEVLDRWLAPDHGYFKVLAADGAIYILRNDPARGDWALVMYDRDGRALAGQKKAKAP